MPAPKPAVIYTATIRLHRFVIGQPLMAHMTINDRELCHQWAKVLRLETGDQLIAVDGQGHEGTCTLTELRSSQARLQCSDVRDTPDLPLPKTTLYCAVLKRENFEWVVQKATELGVSSIVPVVSERTIKTGLKLERLEKIAREATEQSGRGIVPALHEPLAFQAALRADTAPIRLFFHTGPILDRAPLQASERSLWIGPEGGWTNTEVLQAKAAGCHICSLGPLVLRAETAAVCACFEVLR